MDNKLKIREVCGEYALDILFEDMSFSTIYFNSKRNAENVKRIIEIDGGKPNEATDDELELINRFTRRNLAKNEVYAFSVVLCDNDVDRDGERFTTDSLYELEKLFVGKTGIIDHNPSAKNQTARIFSCKVEKIDGQKTALGDDYYRLKARAYLPVCESNRDIILAIDSGIIKEVSVGCAVGRVVCNVCGEDTSMCTHKKGEVYGSKLCCGELVNPYDAYEWSFVLPLNNRKE